MAQPPHPDSRYGVSVLCPGPSGGRRTKYPAPGIAGGEDGGCGRLQVNGETVGTKEQYVLSKGDTVELSTPGGGGYGPPEERDPAAE